MSLLKLVPNPAINQWAQQKAIEVLNSIPSQSLILEAYLFGGLSYCKNALQSR